jgi:hypothetical protein
MTNTPRIADVPTRVTVELDRDLLTRLRPEAARRSTTVPQLVRDVLAIAAALDNSEHYPVEVVVGLLDELKDISGVG